MSAGAARARTPPARPLLASSALALLLGATAADLLGAALDAPALWIGGAWLELAGVAAGVLALVARLGAGLRASPPRPRALRGALPRLGALSLFALAAWVRGDATIPPDPAVLLAESIAAALLLAGEWTDRRTPNAPGR